MQRSTSSNRCISKARFGDDRSLKSFFLNAFIDILACMIEKYGPQMLKDLEEKRTSEFPKIPL